MPSVSVPSCVVVEKHLHTPWKVVNAPVLTGALSLRKVTHQNFSSLI